MGPRLNAGKNVSAPRIRTTLMRSTVNNGVLTGNVPGEGGTLFFIARLPASANTGTIMRKRPINMAQPRAVLYHHCTVGLVGTVRPAKAEPLFPTAEVKA